MKKIDSQPTAFYKGNISIRGLFLERLGFKLSDKMGYHSLYLTPYNISSSFKKEIKNVIINENQKINKFLNCLDYCTKSSLYMNYKIFKEKYPSDFNYMLESYLYPLEKDKIESIFKNYTLNNTDNIWMVKPNIGLSGINISLLTNFSEINLKDYIITKYLYNSHLIKGYKYDLRFHGLVSSIKPLKLYLYNEGLVRLASEKHNFSASFHQNKFAFITNLHLNIKNKKKFIYPKNLSNIENSNLWNLETFQNFCSKNNINYDKLYHEVADIFIKAIISVREKIIEDMEKHKFEISNFYHLIGFDIILDDNLKPYLLELNRECGFRNNNDAEKYFTFNIITDTLNIIGIKINQTNANQEKKGKLDTLTEHLKESLCELDRPRGGYELIFPLKKNFKKYKKFYGENIPEEDKELWNNLFE